MISRLASAFYGAAAARRRQWYERHPDRIRRLARPVVSVGNLSVGGSGKTPAVAWLARMLVERGERPAVLSRGYGRRDAVSVRVVSDGTRVTSDVEHAGDEPFLLATSLPGVPVVVAANRFEAGRTAEQSLGATVHLLDDGFQHLQLARDVDLVIVSRSDLTDRVLPAGRLREPLATIDRATAVLTDGPSETAVRQAFSSIPVFAMTRTLEAVRLIQGTASVDRRTRVFVFAAIARPERFERDLKDAGWAVAGARWFRDHHWYTAADRLALVEQARAAGATVLLTTEKDAVRLGGAFGDDMTVGVVPLSVGIDPSFTPWLVDRLRQAPGSGLRA